MEVKMLEENGGKSLSWGLIIAVAVLLLASLGGLIYFFTTSYNTTPLP
jgi:hypothetical protein